MNLKLAFAGKAARLGAMAGLLAGGSIPGSIQQLRAGWQIEGTGINRDDSTIA
jgi:hypothetical protein